MLDLFCSSMLHFELIKHATDARKFNRSFSTNLEWFVVHILDSLISLITVSKSLSPLPDRLTRTTWSFLIFGARLTASARAWDDSRAGIIPSVLHSNENASNASSSVADV